jgi:aspartate/methionine/tyrosine aminotransferase
MGKLTQIGWKVERPQGAIYLWVPIPDGFTSDEFAEVLFNNYSVLVCPGIGFGELGEGYIRLAMTCSFEDHFAGIDLLCQALLDATKK